MKRFHVHVAVNDLQKGIGFYSTLFGSEPTVLKDDYAKWMLDDPRVNFAISERGTEPGINHLGFQVDEASELDEIRARLEAASATVTNEENVSCCYARSDKAWVTDPAGVAWETFHSLGTVPFYNGDETKAEGKPAAKAACCAPAAKEVAVSAPAPRSACCGSNA